MSLAFPIEINILDFIFKGIIIGVIASAPMGPVGILCIQRTLNKGRWFGFVTGIGAACSDIVYALFTGLGMSFVMDFVNNAQNKFYLQIFGSVLLLVFGVYCFKSDPMKNMHKSSNKQGTLWHNGITAFLVTLSNPLIVFLFMATFAQFAFVVPDMPLEMGMGYLSIMFGALLWWFGLTWLVDKIRGKFDTNGILIINKVIGSIVIIFRSSLFLERCLIFIITRILSYVCSTEIKKRKYCRIPFIYVADRGYHPCLRMLAAGD